MSENYEKAAK